MQSEGASQLQVNFDFGVGEGETRGLKAGPNLTGAGKGSAPDVFGANGHTAQEVCVCTREQLLS